jgi:hypothetical protein
MKWTTIINSQGHNVILTEHHRKQNKIKHIHSRGVRNHMRNEESRLKRHARAFEETGPIVTIN